MNKEDLMFVICKSFQSNKDFAQIAIALDAAFLIGAKRGVNVPDAQATSLMNEKMSKLRLPMVTIDDIKPKR